MNKKIHFLNCFNKICMIHRFMILLVTHDLIVKGKKKQNYYYLFLRSKYFLN